MSIDISPHPRWRVEHRNVRALHGMLSTITGSHTGRWPRFALVPWPSPFGWAVYLRLDDDARLLANQKLAARLFDANVRVHFGPLIRLKSPSVRKRGHRRLRIDAITPVCIRQTDGEMYTAPTTETIMSAIGVEFPSRVGLQSGDVARLRLELIERHTMPAMVPVGGKYGAVRGWVGHCLVETNAVGEWLLRAAERVGLGGRTAFGFGRIRVT